MKKIMLSLPVVLALGFSSCCGCDHHTSEDNHTTDSTHAVHDEHEEEESTIAFDGVDRGEYTLYGHTDITADGFATVTEMFTEMESTGAFNRKVKVSIQDVCQQAGCWITFDDEQGGAIRVFFRDHFTIPIETPSGTEAILLGALQIDTLSVDFQKHLLDDAAAAGEEVSQEEYDAITEDKIEKTFDCESILVKKQH
ncbi:MAG: DUF4920 domain-containing protein [Crocinitomicaceae bacterium]|nr:DUF4920 domain-containing protein [Crocinitomicaceae bacterium]MBK8926717.1 DUF4920 domain-containing protein [Crocinitomicaceae bacterium]